MEYWNSGIMGSGRMEWWILRIKRILLILQQKLNKSRQGGPTFHYSIIPSFFFAICFKAAAGKKRKHRRIELGEHDI